MQEIGLDATVLLFSLGLSVASGVLFGLAPALSVTGPALFGSLHQGSRSIAGSRPSRWMRSGLVIVEVGLAVVLLVGTGLLARSFSVLEAEDPGVRTKDRLVLATPLPRQKYPKGVALTAFADAALARMRALPGVESAALASLVPLGGQDQIWGFWIHGRASSEGDGDGSALFYRVSPGYFGTMGIPLRAGRDIAESDRESSPRVAVVSESFAGKFLGGENPLGKRVRFGRSADG
jgi:hypothetical protein